MARKRWTGTTKERGYGHGHQAERERRIMLYRPGDICAHGGEPMPWWPLNVARQYLVLPHTADRSGYLPGLSCWYHNARDGAIRGNQMRGLVRSWARARRWLAAATVSNCERFAIAETDGHHSQ